MESKPIFLSMAAIDGEKAAKNRWLPEKLFPQLTHRIAAAGGADYRCKFSGGECERDIGQSLCLPVQCMIGITDVGQFQDWFHRVHFHPCCILFNV